MFSMGVIGDGFNVEGLRGLRGPGATAAWPMLCLVLCVIGAGPSSTTYYSAA